MAVIGKQRVVFGLTSHYQLPLLLRGFRGSEPHSVGPAKIEQDVLVPELFLVFDDLVVGPNLFSAMFPLPVWFPEDL